MLFCEEICCPLCLCTLTVLSDTMHMASSQLLVPSSCSGLWDTITPASLTADFLGGRMRAFQLKPELQLVLLLPAYTHMKLRRGRHLFGVIVTRCPQSTPVFLTFILVGYEDMVDNSKRDPSTDPHADLVLDARPKGRYVVKFSFDKNEILFHPGLPELT